MKVLAAVYEVDQPRDAWFAGVLRAAAGSLSRGGGVGGVLYDLSTEPHLRVDALDGIDIPPDWIQAGADMHHDPRMAAGMKVGYGSLLCATLPELSAVDRVGMEAARRDYYAPRNLSNQIMINGLDGSGKGFSLFLFSKKEALLSSDARGVFSCLATHLATGYRLQRRLAQAEPPSMGEIEAVLTPDGEIAHAEAPATARPARQALKLAVRDRESTGRSRLADPDGILKGWRGLISARWTLVDDYERGGRRYILARENAPMGRGPAALSSREKQVVSLAALGRSNKLISYELGLAHSTVRVLMSRACAKLGATSRSELLSLARLHAACKPE